MTTTQVTWTELKVLATAKEAAFQYLEYTSEYVVWINNVMDRYEANIAKDAGADQVEFEASYKSAAKGLNIDKARVALYDRDFVGITSTAHVDSFETKQCLDVNICGAGVALDIDQVTIDNGPGALAVNIQDGGNSITVDGTVSVNSNFEYAEDSVHIDGDVGNFPLTVRADTAASTAGTDGDYAAFITNSTGDLYVTLDAELIRLADKDGNGLTSTDHTDSFTSKRCLDVNICGADAELAVTVPADTGIMRLRPAWYLDKTPVALALNPTDTTLATITFDGQLGGLTLNFDRDDTEVVLVVDGTEILRVELNDLRENQSYSLDQTTNNRNIRFPMQVGRNGKQFLIDYNNYPVDVLTDLVIKANRTTAGAVSMIGLVVDYRERV